jgi:hypothetical protein
MYRLQALRSAVPSAGLSQCCFQVPESGGEPAEGEVNVVAVQQDPNQSSEDLTFDFASEGKPWSITYFCQTPATFPFMQCLRIYVQELN